MWQWKDEGEFAKRLKVGVDTPEHQTKVRTAGLDLIRRYEAKEMPFEGSWSNWQVPNDIKPCDLPENWAHDYGSHALLSNASW